MYLHLGNNVNIPEKEIIGIFSLKIKKKPCNRELIQYAFLEEIGSFKEYNSFIVTSEKIFLSPVVSSTLGKRMMHEKM